MLALANLINIGWKQQLEAYCCFMRAIVETVLSCSNMTTGRIVGSFALQHSPTWTKQGAASLMTLGPASEPAHGVWDAPGMFI